MLMSIYLLIINKKLKDYKFSFYFLKILIVKALKY